MRPVRQVRERGGQLYLYPLLGRVPADRLIAPRLACLAVGGDEPPSRFPLRPPPSLREPCGVKVVPRTGKPPTAPAHTHVPVLQSPLHGSGPRSQLLEALPFLPPLRLGGVPAPPPGRQHDAPFELPDACQQGSLPGLQVSLRQIPLIIAGPGDRPRPPGRRQCGEPLLADAAGCGAPGGVQTALPYPRGKVRG